jgi:ABC-2 type transport system ATP-binding protein
MTAAIEILNLNKRFGNRIALEDLTLTVNHGEVFGFVGPNGAGKTTTIRIISGLLRPSDGEVTVDGHSVFGSPNEIKRLIGYMPDYFGVYPDLKTWEYLDFFAACYQIKYSERPGLIDGLLELVELSHRKDDLVDRLSRGMKQRLSLARVLIHDPQILILDEPAAGLDPRARIEIRELLVELAQMGKTVFFSTHILADVAEICNRVGIIEAGKLVAAGELEKLQLQILPIRRVRITVLRDLITAIQILETIPGVSAISPARTIESPDGRQEVSIEFSGDDQTLSDTLAELVKAGIPVLHFIEDSRDLEEVFLHATKGLVT